MAEHCPLFGNGMATDTGIPGYCRATCGELWDHAERTQSPQHDEYEQVTDTVYALTWRPNIPSRGYKLLMTRLSDYIA